MHRFWKTILGIFSFTLPVIAHVIVHLCQR